MTKSIEEDNQLIFIDRAGYGFSEDTKTDRTVEQIVEDYRTVLKNMGEEGPYILLAHSISGLYVSYWQNKYPDEIESVIIMDGTLYIDEERGNYSNNRSRIFYAAEKVGLQSIIMKNVYGALADIDNMTGKELDMNVYMFSKTTGTHAIMSESNLIYQNAKNVIDNLKPNDIPKIYIDAINAFDENPEKKEKKWIPYEEKIGNCELVPLYGKHAIYMDRTEECAKIIKDHIDSLK